METSAFLIFALSEVMTLSPSRIPYAYYLDTGRLGAPIKLLTALLF